MTLPRDVAAKLEVFVGAPTELEMQITVAKLPGLELTEELKVEVDGSAITPEEIVDEHGSRIHRLDLQPSLITI